MACRARCCSQIPNLEEIPNPEIPNPKKIPKDKIPKTKNAAAGAGIANTSIRRL
jgi:hypothetical protein